MKTATTRRLSLAALAGAGLLQLQMLRAQNTTIVRTVVGGQTREQTVMHRGTSPAPDSDGDGYDDDQERALGTDPTDPASKGAVEPTLLSRTTTTAYSTGYTLQGPGLAGFLAGTTTHYKKLVVRQTVTEEVPPDLPAGAWEPSPDLGLRTFTAEYDPNAPERWRISGQRVRLDNFPDPSLVSTFDMTRNWHSPANPPSGAVSDTVRRASSQYVAHPRGLDSVDVIIRIEIEWTLSEPGAPVEVPPGLVSETRAWAVGPVVARRAGSDETVADYMVVMPAGTTGVVRWLEVFTPADGTAAQVSARAWTMGAGETKSPAFTLSCPADGQAEVLLKLGALLVDSSRDGVIALPGDEGFPPDPAPAAAQPFRFWINDDDDNGDDINGDDVPGSSSPDGQQIKVQGTRDLVDFFPVFLDLKQLLTVLPPSASVKYKLKNADDGLRFVYTDLSRADAFKYLRDFATGNSLKAADAHWATNAGYELAATWLSQVKDGDKGVILVEGRSSTDKPLVLSVEKADGGVLVEVKLEIKIVPVETMFRHLNLHDRNLPGLVGAMSGGPAHPEAMGDPTGFPDNSNSDSRWLIFVHGFNVSGQAGRGWNAEMFKRCYWSGNKSRFVGVSWFGNPDQVLGAISDYHLSVRNAMVTAPVLAQEINALTGGSGAKTVFAHSLGCGVISSALADHGMNVNRVCFVDAALALECFDARNPDSFTSENDGMTPAIWRPYSPRLYAANWFARFDPTTDARGKLTWNSRFSGAGSVVYNFYSSTEDVLAEYTGELPSTFGGLLWAPGHLGTFGWVYQEKGKGNRQNYLFQVTAQGVTELTHLGSYFGGWGMNLKDPVLSGDTPYWKWINSQNYIGRLIKTSVEIGTVSDSVLRRHPMFEPGWGLMRNQQQQENPVSDVSPVDGAPSWIYDLYLGTAGNALAGNPGNRSQLLAEAIPALTWCMGSHESKGIDKDKNFNIPTLVDQVNWPRGKPDNVTPEWRHSDMREVAYLYQYGVFDEIVALSKP